MRGYELYKKLQFNINPNELDEILYHASFQPQDRTIFKRNKEYISWGNAIVKSLLSLHIYLSDISYKSSEITKISSSMYLDVIDNIYETYGLEEFTYVSNGEAGKKHTDTASKLVALLYKTNGLQYTYELLKPILSKYAGAEKLDYRTILQEFAQKRKLPFEYNIINREGPDEAPIFTCELTVGNKKCIATGSGKKAAFRNVAEKFVVENHIPVGTKKQSSREKSVNDKVVLSSERRNQLLRIFKDLHITTEELPLNYMNATLVHKSIHNDMKNKDAYVDNDAISMIGAEIVSVLTFDYVYNTYESEYVDVIKEKSALLDSINLQEVLPDEWVKCLIAGKSVKSINQEGIGSLKIDVFKAILGGLVLYALHSYNKKSEECTKNLAFYFIDKVKENKIPDYITLLQAVAQQTGSIVQEEIIKYNENGDNNPLFVSVLKYSDKKETFSTRGEGTTKRRAKNVASHEMLNQLLLYYQDRMKIQKIILSVLAPERYVELEKLTWEIEKNICVLNSKGAKRKIFATISNHKEKDVYDIGIWEKNERKQGVTFTADEAKQLSELLDRIAPIEAEPVIEETKQIEVAVEDIDPLVEEVVEGKENKLSSNLTNEQKLEIIRAELISGNSFEKYQGNSTKLLPHQKAACRIADMYNKFAFFYDTGTGKTVLALDIITSKYKKDKAKFLIICPKPIIQTAWMDDQKNF